jgi:hypothetical protein
MKYDLIKLLHWLSQSTFKSKWFEQNIKFQIISLLSWFLYPDFRKEKSIFDILRANKMVLFFISTFFVWSITFFTFGRLSSNENVVVRKYFSYNTMVDTTITRRLIFDTKIRTFIEYTAKEKYKVKYYQNLQKLSDEVFFTIVSEIHDKELPYSVFFRLLDQESHFLYVVNKNSGAKGFVQIIPSTERILKRKVGSTGYHLIDNIRYGAHHLKISYNKYKSRGFSEEDCWFHSLLDYNGGSNILAKETMLYFDKDIELLKKGD